MTELKALIQGESSNLQAENDDEVVDLRPLRKAVETGDVDAVEDFIHRHPHSVQKKIANYGRTALHIATLAGNTKMVQVLVEFMSEDDLKRVDRNGESSLIYAATIGSTRIAEIMVEKSSDLVTVGVPAKDSLPVTVACHHGHRETARYLYSVTPFDLLEPKSGAYGSLLLHESISREMFDISLDLLQRCPSIATTVNHLDINPLHEFASLRYLFPSGTHFVFWKHWIYSRLGQLRNLVSNFLDFFGLKQIYEKKLTHAYAFKILHIMCEHIKTIEPDDFRKNGVYLSFFVAIREGVIEVVVEMIKSIPSLVSALDNNLRGMLMLAVQHRQEKIFSLVHVLDMSKFMSISHLDKDRNTMLHVAAKLAPSRRLSRISGAALQMQRELQWYKEVESIVNPLAKAYVNDFEQRPGDIFSSDHYELVADGEKWMKDTATSCTVVGALIITIMFTAAFTVPGGNHQETGFPIFLHEKSFRIFLISDAISLFASSTSVLMFLGVLTSRYSEEDFLKSLPTKLIIGLSTLFVSIAAMMVSFCATIILMLRDQLNLVMPIVLLASIPVSLFVVQQFPLLVEIFVSTYGPGIFDRKLKYWYTKQPVT
ncbi:uncharacterized protein LOC126677327 isoform X2 [Mercurialis annua]|uniref:uncharacterized protein LOC126677327 isoform X2 n=1 Tax=Mercurialis annua TaxID=3986 RepID=UPI0024AF2320|nr:uncharacterized protein LOC126677327 isoform X2 [Mercurialis annua]